MIAPASGLCVNFSGGHELQATHTLASQFNCMNAPESGMRTPRRSDPGVPVEQSAESRGFSRLLRLNPGSIALLLAGILVLSLILNIYNIGFPLGYHGDEPKKVQFILTGTQDFHHPILLLQLARAANLVTRFESDQQVVLISRVVSAIAGTAMVLFSFLFARRAMSCRLALLVALGIAVSPILVIHAHYLKEDVLYTACALCSIFAFTRLVELPGRLPVILFGIATGLALSSHYKSGLLLAIYLVFPLVGTVEQRWHVLKRLLIGLCVAAYVFLNVNLPLIDTPEIFHQGVQHEFDHVLAGHSLKIYAAPQYYCFHLINSIIPGMTWLPVLLALLWCVAIPFQWRAVGWLDQLLFLFVGLNYFAPELSPSKPAPDFARYILPIVPVMIYFAFRSIQAAWTLATWRPARWAIAAVAGVSLLWPAADSIFLDYHIARDTRAKAREWLAAHAGDVIREHYSAVDRDVVSLGDVDLTRARADGVAYLVASSFTYDRYFFGSRLANQDPYVYQRHKRYVELFAHPYVEFRPVYKSFAFSNPVIRIVDIRIPAETD